jgi:hypothetical protein
MNELQKRNVAETKAIELVELVENLCEDITHANHMQWKHTRDTLTHDYSIGKKYIKIFTVEDGQSRSVWGFINIGNDKFQVGDVLKSAGWATPALNKPRGNLYEGYEIKPGTSRMYGPDYLR